MTQPQPCTCKQVLQITDKFTISILLYMYIVYSVIKQVQFIHLVQSEQQQIRSVYNIYLSNQETSTILIIFQKSEPSNPFTQSFSLCY